MTRRELAQAIVDAMRVINLRFWEEWGPRFASLPAQRQEELQREVNELIEEERLRLMGVVDGPPTTPGDPPVTNLLGPYPGPMTMVGQDYAGDPADPRYALGTHSHPVAPTAETDPVLVASRVYPAKIVDPLNRGFFTCCYLGPHYAGGNVPMFRDNLWTVLAPGVLECTVEGPLPAE